MAWRQSKTDSDPKGHLAKAGREPWLSQLRGAPGIQARDPLLTTCRVLCSPHHKGLSAPSVNPKSPRNPDLEKCF